MRRGAWAAVLAGAVATALGLGASELVGGLLHQGTSPVTAVGEAVIQFVPGGAVEAAIGALGTLDKPLLVAGTVLITLLVGALAGLLARHVLLAGLAVLAALWLLAGGAILSAGGGSDDVVTTAVAVTVAAVVLALLVRRVPTGREDGAHPTRRGFLLLTGTAAVGAVALAVAGTAIGRDGGWSRTPGGRCGCPSTSHRSRTVSRSTSRGSGRGGPPTRTSTGSTPASPSPRSTRRSGAYASTGWSSGRSRSTTTSSSVSGCATPG
ncbi:hypothetical protein [Janibacter corallicola]|uniref:hypothetical protein n=1 Tax=Janibacter corallicola TaxID=415212 RepID=UPI000A7AABCD